MLATPATLFWAVPFTLYYLFLQVRVVHHRLHTKV